MDALASWGNLFAAADKARRGKRRRPDVEAWWMRRETELAALREELRSGSYRPGPYHFFEIREPKRRVIAASPFRDRVVHHALCNLLAPVMERQFIARSFSCQIGKGTTAARECCRKLVNRYRYVLKCDVRKFFPSIDHETLLALLEPKVRCPSVRALLHTIISSYHTEGRARPCGLPIGNLTSQLWGNLYLDGLDHIITERWQCGAMVRYTDDFLIFGDDRAALGAMKHAVAAELAKVHLHLAEPKSRLLATREGVPFCGFRFLPGLRPRVLGATKRRFEQRKHRLMLARDYQRVTQTVFAWYQFSKEGNTEGLRKAYASG